MIKPELNAQGGDTFGGGAGYSQPPVAAGPAPGPGQSGPLPEGFEDAHRALLSDGRLQFELTPFEAPEQNTGDLSWLEPVARFFEAIAPFLVYVFYAGLAIIALLLLYVIVTEVIRRWPQRKRKIETETAEAPKPEYKPAMTRARALLDEADRLAAEGRYGEAARVLLHRSIEDIERAFSMAIGPGLTSREIGQIEPLSPQGRSVFSGIARAVETSLFGERPLSADEYARCRQSYASFALQGSAR